MKRISLLAFLFLITLFSCKNQQAVNHENKPPNVILILTDDQGYGDLSCHGNPIMKTPNLDKFEETALELTNFHVGTTCTPTRAGLLTGRNSNRNGTWHTISGCSILNREEETIADVFKRNGYRTAMFGKWHLGDNYPYRPHDRGFDETLYCGGGGVWQTPDYWLNDYFDDTYFRNGTPEKTEGYCTDVWFSETIQYIEANKEEPFFIYLAPNAAHYPFNVPEEYLNMYKNADLTTRLKRFYGMVSNLDHNFGRLRNYLKEQQLEDNTILIYTTDNGTAGGIQIDQETGKEYGYNAGLRYKKGSQYDGGHRVPFFLSYPNGGFNKGKKISELIAHVDMLPTLAALCELEYNSKKTLDGENCLSQLKGKEEKPDRLLVIDTQRNQWPEKGRRSCVMSRDWRLVNGVELYNTKEDPGQKNDVATQFPERIKKMNQFYDQWWESTIPDFEYSPLVLGHENANPTQITVHDMHSEQMINWNQVQIRKAQHNPQDGYYTVEFDSAGEYEFNLSRYPQESELAFNSVAAEVIYQDHLDGFPAGKVLKITKAIVEIDDQLFEGIVDDKALSVRITGSAEEGIAELKSWFVLEDDTMIPAYYTQVRKL